VPFEVDTNGTLETNLKFYARFEENTGTTTTDAIGNKIGTLQAGATWIAGKVGNGIAGGGTDLTSIQYTGDPPITVVNNWSMTAWVKPKTLPVTNGQIISNDSTGTAGYLMLIGDGNGGSGSQLEVLFGFVAWIGSGTNLTLNVWQHVVVLRSAGTTKFYINAVQTPNTSTATPLTPAGALRIGDKANDIDECGMWTKALTQQEITDLYNGGAGNAYAIADERFHHRQELWVP